MRHFKNSFLQQFAGGFVIGAVGLLAFQPADATRALASRFTGEPGQTQAQTQSPIQAR